MGRAKRALAGAAAAAVLFTGVVGFAHTPAGRPLRPLLRLLGAAAPAACPLGYDRKASPEQREAARRAFAAAHAGPSPAAARPTPLFELGVTRREAVLTWAAAAGVRCAPPRSGHDLECLEVPAAALPGAEVGASALWLDFDEAGALTALTAVRRDASAARISAAYRAVTAGLGRAGPPAAASGTGSPEELSAGLLRQASAEYRFRDFYALARATNLGDGFVLTEEYRAL